MACSLSLKEEFLICLICTEFYTDPCTLGCQHSFCRKCLTDYIKTRPDAVQSRKIPCAFCRQDTRVPNPTRPVAEWAGQFKPGLMLRGLMDRLHSGHKQREGQEVCFLCEVVGETTLATSWCCDCEVTLCSRCAKMHLQAPSSNKHDVCDLSGGAKVKQRRKVKCSDHEREQITYICKDCNKSVCQICCIIEHRACSHVVTIESMISEIKSALTEEKRNLEKKMQDNMAYVKQEETKLQQLKDEKEASGSKIKSEIESCEGDLLKKVGDVTDKHISQHRANIKSGQITSQMYQHHFQFIDQVLQSESEMEMYEMYQVSQSGAVTSVGDTELDTRNTPVVKEVAFTPSMEPLRKAITEIGRADVTFLKAATPMSGTGHRLTNKTVTLSTHVLCDTIDIKHRDDPGEPCPVDVTVLTVNGVIAVVTADFGNNLLKSVYVENCRKTFSVLALPGIPLSVDKMSGNRVAATVKYFHIVVAELRPELVLISKTRTTKQYWTLTSLPDSTLAAGSSSPPGVDILDLGWNVIRSFTPLNTGLKLLQNPYYMCTSLEGNVLVTDVGSRSVYCLTPQGGVVFTYTSTGYGRPVGITVTDTGAILLSTGYPYSIILLTSTGTFIRTVLTSADDIGEPCGICVHDRHKLYVCKRGDVKVFRFT